MLFVLPEFGMHEVTLRTHFLASDAHAQATVNLHADVNAHDRYWESRLMC